MNTMIDENFDPEKIRVNCLEFGHIPLPPYMKREDEEFDAERYHRLYMPKI